MKVKASITLSEEVFLAIDRETGTRKNKSEFIEKALRDYLRRIARSRQNAVDLDIINRTADRLNDEAADVLTYQIVP